MTKLLNQQKAMLDSLTATQQAEVAANTVGGSTSSGTVTTSPIAYPGPTGSQADEAVQYAYSKIGEAVRVGRHRPQHL